MVIAVEDQGLKPSTDSYLVWPIHDMRAAQARECRRQTTDCAGATTELRLVLF
jgi:hypothetical protein